MKNTRLDKSIWGQSAQVTQLRGNQKTRIPINTQFASFDTPLAGDQAFRRRTVDWSKTCPQGSPFTSKITMRTWSCRVERSDNPTSVVPASCRTSTGWTCHTIKIVKQARRVVSIVEPNP